MREQLELLLEIQNNIVEKWVYFVYWVSVDWASFVSLTLPLALLVTLVLTVNKV